MEANLYICVARTLVLVVDRDDDLGQKAGVKGPVIGYEKILEAANALALADPEDSDVNTLFYALKVYKDLSDKGEEVQVACVTGHPALGLLADRRVRQQLEKILDTFPAEEIVFVTDGAEDDQVIPIVLSFAPIVSKKLVVVRQAKELEKTFYTIKTALKDPTLARLFLGLPGLLLLLWFFLGDIGTKLIVGILAMYLILRGFGLDEKIGETVRAVVRGISLRSPAAPVYFLSLALFLLSFYFAYRAYIYYLDAGIGVHEGIRVLAGFLALSSLTYLGGRLIDDALSGRPHLAGRRLRDIVSVLLAWTLVDGIVRLLENFAVLPHLLFTFVALSMLYYVVYRIALAMEAGAKLSENVIGVPVYTRDGRKVGKVVGVKVEDQVLTIRGRERFDVHISRLRIAGDRLVLYT